MKKSRPAAHLHVKVAEIVAGVAAEWQQQLILLLPLRNWNSQIRTRVPADDFSLPHRAHGLCGQFQTLVFDHLQDTVPLDVIEASFPKRRVKAHKHYEPIAF